MADRCESVKYSSQSPAGLDFTLDQIQCTKPVGHEQSHSGYAGPFGRMSWTDNEVLFNIQPAKQKNTWPVLAGLVLFQLLLCAIIILIGLQ